MIVTVTTKVSFSEPLSIREQEVVKATYKSQLETWYSAMALVFSVKILKSRRGATTYTLLGTAVTSDPSAGSSTSTPMLSRAFASELSSALPDVANSGATTSVTSKLESTGAGNEEDADRNNAWFLENKVLIATILGSIAITSLFGFVVYREWSRRQIPIGDCDMVVDDSEDQAVPCPFVDNADDVIMMMSSELHEIAADDDAPSKVIADHVRSFEKSTEATCSGNPVDYDEPVTSSKQAAKYSIKIAYLPYEIPELERNSPNVSFHDVPTA